MRWLIERQLKQTSARLRSAREDLVRLDYEIDSFATDADDLQTRSVVSGQIDAEHDYAEAAHQVEVLRKAREDLRTRIEGLSRKQDELLDQLSASAK